MDAFGNAILAEQLQAARVRSYDQRFPEFKARQLVPVSHSDNPGLETIVWYRYTTVGSFKLITAYSDDLPRSDIQAEKESTLVRDLGGAYGYNINEVQAAVFAGQPLPPRKAAAMRRSYEQEIDVLAALGDSGSNLVGLLNQPNAIAVTIPAGASTQTEWTDKTAAEIYADLIAMRRQVRLTTKNVEDINTILIPEEQHGLIEDTFFNDETGETILERFNARNPGVEVIAWHRCSGAGAGGADRMVAYRRDPNYLELIIPKEATELEPEQRNLETVINAHARFGGVVVYVPYSMAYADGI